MINLERLVSIIDFSGLYMLKEQETITGDDIRTWIPHFEGCYNYVCGGNIDDGVFKSPVEVYLGYLHEVLIVELDDKGNIYRFRRYEPDEEFYGFFDNIPYDPEVDLLDTLQYIENKVWPTFEGCSKEAVWQKFADKENEEEHAEYFGSDEDDFDPRDFM